MENLEVNLKVLLSQGVSLLENVGGVVKPLPYSRPK